MTDSAFAPLAERMRPRDLSDVVGQAHLLGPGRPLAAALDRGRISSMILWGPPGVGKTTLARLIAEATDALLLRYSAVSAGVKEIREAVAAAREAGAESIPRPTVLFLDEIHRFNKAQQDVLLPRVEEGTLALVGATTENPAYSVTAALLSRCRVFALESLKADELSLLIDRGIAELAKSGQPIRLASDTARDGLLRAADGDARRLLGALEAAADVTWSATRDAITDEDVTTAVGRNTLRHDRGGTSHYDLLSAFHKSLRASDADASVYWMARLLEAGEDPMVVARRMLRFASEDIGNADPQALPLAQAAWDATRALGLPEADAALAQCAVYLACAPKSDASPRALGAARDAVRKLGALDVPATIRSAASATARASGAGGYDNPQRHPGHVRPQQMCLPEALDGQVFYDPSDPLGFEREIRKRLDYWRKLRDDARPSR